MSHSVNTGLSTGSFHTLSVRASNGSMTNILSLISAGSGLSSAEVSALIVAALTSYPSTTAVHTSINSAITTYATSDALQLAAALVPYSTTSQLSVLLGAKQATLSMGVGAFLTGTTLSGYSQHFQKGLEQMGLHNSNVKINSYLFLCWVGSTLQRLSHKQAHPTLAKETLQMGDWSRQLRAEVLQTPAHTNKYF